MKHWEFLLQKDGDRSWLPLDSPDVEILEGRYRVVARSSHPETSVSVQISHLATDTMPPKRRTQKRNGRTNKEGLMVVIPFTRLEPGTWELRCASSDVMSDLTGEGWQAKVQLQVLARDSEAEEWEPDWSPTTTSDRPEAAEMEQTTPAPTPSSDLTTQADLPTLPSPQPPSPPLEPLKTNPVQVPLDPEVAEILGASIDRLFQIAEQMSNQLVDEVLKDFDLAGDGLPDLSQSQSIPLQPSLTSEPLPPQSIPQSDSPPTTTLPPEPNPARGMLFALSLHQEVFLANGNEAIVVAGQVAPETEADPADSAYLKQALPAGIEIIPDPWEAETPAIDLRQATPQELQICLRDPQSLQVLFSDRQPFVAQIDPYPFEFTVSLPGDLSTHLVLGEVLLCGALPDREGQLIALTTQAFTITLNPTGLVDELAKLNEVLTHNPEDVSDSGEGAVELAKLAEEEVLPALELSFLKKPIEVEPPAVEAKPRFPSLAGQPLPPQLYRPDPEASRQRPIELPLLVLSNPSQVAPESTAAEASAGATLVGEEASPEPDQETITAEIAPEAVPAAPDLTIAHPPEPEPAPPPPAEPPAVELPSPIQMAFQALKLQDRFLTRLNSLATDRELSTWLKTNLHPGSISVNHGNQLPPSLEDKHLATEIVVIEDEPVAPAAGKPSRSTSLAGASVDSGETANPLILPEDEAVPTPTLEITSGELTAGKPVNVRVRLPDLLPRIYVKLWINDRQTRSLLDTPRWLVDFSPNGFGELEATTQLTVPFGSLAVRFEAVAVEMPTQRESHKVSVDRSVIPPDLPVMSLEDFDT